MYICIYVVPPVTILRNTMINKLEERALKIAMRDRTPMIAGLLEGLDTHLYVYRYLCVPVSFFMV